MQQEGVEKVMVVWQWMTEHLKCQAGSELMASLTMVRVLVHQPDQGYE